MKHCSWCDQEFKSNISYQIYCSIECRDEATKQKIATRYMITRRQKRKGKDRRCKSCKQVLSIYNDDMLCGLCQVNPKDVDKALKDIKGRMNEKR
jgi:hypothetical protein